LSTPKVNRHMEVALSGVHADMYPVVVPLKLRAGIALFSPSNLFSTDGSLSDGVAGFAVDHSIDCNIQYELDKGNGITKNLAAYPSVRVRL
jgi:hypothetical protein